jgi:hypothetical protein
MQNIDWNSYRHSKFLKSLSLTNCERKYLNLFLNKGKLDNIENVENTSKARLIPLAEA